MSRTDNRFLHTRIAWHARGRADTIRWLTDKGYLAPQQLAQVCEGLNLDSTDMFHADLRANDCTEPEETE